ncbi:bifunctional phosphoribosylaminoimidazolecarboxamide formyltransferase/IMP cyclohydrolase [Tsukamurella sp. 8F]|uniref:bifunctional phosphoribosylaminoimidazolecarboxamide formyltransferase/IMP cyclohydrolase n=1 Tax=unclassified Tsukamurella TaxID=2633480 RepID=UPI0023B98B15|nr:MULTISPECIES: bifunctional phosphoribosylaminoimidazolecarboxamide formyltransferase/IMP cyclohydrolase [unclassified Tsukamurella]MDF0532523.1 bifunctional phosphoribosylaminoimidazolecarboxamide formyltransferase/IMP cyclohydrolase [Tsukamurella sp. 8J]MDF0589409.1 bifunctional phosphoribosylaminoimidazolecarboxamide formyltransferase/IMP cyclohydrolase [Tsukamurella sp. 8F]
MSSIPFKRALISVYDKTGLVELATGLEQAGVEIVSTGSTAKTIADAGVAVTRVEDLTGFPECLDGRVKTLHPRVHAGILADTRLPDHVQQLKDLGVQRFELVVVNLYPFTDTVASGATEDECVEQIDIGGPSMVRAAAKNHPSVTVVVSPDDYTEVIDNARVGFSLERRKSLAAKAFRHTADYDIAVASYMTDVVAAPSEESADSHFPTWMGGSWRREAVLRYGENPHQGAALYAATGGSGIAQAEQLHGKAMSYNNYTDGDAAWRSAWDFTEPAVAIIKHANPCGIAIGKDVAQAHRRAHASDPVSAYGGVIAANREVSVEMAEQVSEIFTEVIIAPSYAPGALELLTKKKNVRILLAQPPVLTTEVKQISGGVLLQDTDAIDAAGDDPAEWTLATGEPADEATLADLEFAWRAVRSVKSNAILLASRGASVGVGMGQVNRVDAAQLAVNRAGDRVVGSVAASDAFFPFPDGPQILIDAGVKAIVQPGGSIHDKETIEVAQEAGVTMYFTGTRHFFH